MYRTHERYFKLWVENDVLIAVFRGQWDAAITHAYADEFKKVAESIIHKPWAHITYLDDWELADQDFFPIIGQLESWCIQNGIVRDAVVFPPNALKSHVLSKALKTSKYSEYYREFSRADEALRWLSEKGFSPISDTLSSMKSA
ncbi:hypothetical protein [Aestuariibacter salexigens]|uniref:hypothetical protein n=1 Tax=Aestuariibacter salexigens TaxID=226010 RepID=UPI0003FCA91D|nr:hypothetical protein [Aestuariibacter salexigens]